MLSVVSECRRLTVEECSTPRILLIGACKPLLKALQRGLEEEGFTADLIAPGQERSTDIILSNYDVIVIDLKRPDPTTLQAVRGWRRLGLCMPVIVLTVPGDAGHFAQLETAVDAWLPKPLDLDQFLKCVRDLSHHSACRRGE